MRRALTGILLTLPLAQLTALPGLAEKRALLVGIGDYSGKAVTGPVEPAAKGPAAPGWPRRTILSLKGPPNDLLTMETLLVERFQFPAKAVRVLADGAATRRGILEAIEDHLLEPAKEGDQVVFYFAGHGSQRFNSLSPETDKLDETLVPADTLRGADDIRDKELRRLFDKILDRGARLTVMMDSCHSGSGMRGWAGQPVVRAAHYDPRDVKDGSIDRAQDVTPETRGALELSATNDTGVAQETWDEDDRPMGAFTLAFRRAVATADLRESADSIFQRVRAQLHARRPSQLPVIAGSLAARRAPLFGGPGLANGGTLIAVEKVKANGKAVIAGGRVHGLTEGSLLALRGSGVPQEGSPERLLFEVISLDGPGHAIVAPRTEGEKRLRQGEKTLRSGDLLEVVRWAASLGDPFRVWIPPAGSTATRATAEELRAGLSRWLVADPTEEAVTHFLSWSGEGWILEGPSGSKQLGKQPEPAAVAMMLASSEAPRLFLRLPPLTGLASRLDVGEGKRYGLVEVAEDSRRADFVLVGRFGSGTRAEYAWVRPDLPSQEETHTSLPSRSRWLRRDETLRAEESLAELAEGLSHGASRLALVHRWLTLESPPASSDFPYRLALLPQGEPQSTTGSAHLEDGLLGDGDSLTAGDWLDLLLVNAQDLRWQELQSRHVYVFVLDSKGKGTLVFPNFSFGGVENVLPIQPAMEARAPNPPRRIRLGPPSPSFCASPPYGTDTFFLLTTKEALPDPGVLSFEGARSGNEAPKSALEALIFAMGSFQRGDALPVPTDWSLERLSLRTSPPSASASGSVAKHFSLCQPSGRMPSRVQE